MTESKSCNLWFDKKNNHFIMFLNKNFLPIQNDWKIYLNKNNLSGVQFQLRSYELKSLSHRCWDSLMLSLYKAKSKVKTLGRPSITKSDYLKGITVVGDLEVMLYFAATLK